MSAVKYFTAMREILGKIEATQTEAIKEAAVLVCEAVARGGRFHLLDTGHMLSHEMVGRVGGMMLVTPVNITVNVDNPAPPRKDREKPRVFMDEINGLPAFVLKKSQIYSGDVLLISSVSGKNVLPVETALRARETGVKVIALCSAKYANSLQPAHKSGKRLHEAADVVLDNCGDIGDAMLEAPGMKTKICPSSGIAAAYIMWALEAEIVAGLVKRGLVPAVYRSNHLPGADEYNRKILKDYAERGY